MSTNFGRRPLMLGLGAVAVSPFFSRFASAATADPVQIANTPGSINMVMEELMREQKFLEQFGLAPTVIDVADGSKILGGVIGGSIDLSTMSGFAQLFPAIERGAAVKVLGGAALAPTLAMFTSKPDIKTLKDLEGKTIGTGSVGALVYQLTVTLLKKYNVDTSKIQFVNVGSSTDIFRAVQAGTVDGGVGEASRAVRAEAYKVSLIEHGIMTTELSEYTYQGAWTSQAMIDKNRDLLVRTMAAYAKLYRFAQDPNNKDAYLKAQRNVFKKGPDSTTEDVWNFLQQYKPFATDLLVSKQRIDYLQNLNISFKVQKNMLPYEKLTDMSIAKDAIKLLDKS